MDQAYKDILTECVTIRATPLLLDILFQLTDNENWDGKERLGGNDKKLVFGQLSATLIALDANDLFLALLIAYESKAEEGSDFNLANMPTYGDEHILDLAEESGKCPNIEAAIRKAGGTAKRAYAPLLAPNRVTKGCFEAWLQLAQSEEAIPCYWNIISIYNEEEMQKEPKVDTSFIGVAILAYAVQNTDIALAKKILEEIYSPTELSPHTQEQFSILEAYAIKTEKFEFSALLKAFKADEPDNIAHPPTVFEL